MGSQPDTNTPSEEVIKRTLKLVFPQSTPDTLKKVDIQPKRLSLDFLFDGQKDNKNSAKRTETITTNATTPLEKDATSSTTTSPSSSAQEYLEPFWTENDKLKLNALKKIYQTSAPKMPFSCDWQQVAKEMGRRPGDCVRQHCAGAQHAWTRDEDITLLKLLDSGETDIGDMTSIICHGALNKENRVKNRIKLLERNQLNTMALYEGLSTISEDKPTDDGSEDLTQALDHLKLSDSADTTFKKSMEDALTELDRQKERISNINMKWAIKCAKDMVCRDYGIYYSYYKNDDQRKTAIINGKIEPTLETVLPKVIDGYARSNGTCCYCGRVITFSELTSDHPTTAASPDHFEPRMMAFNSDTYLHFTCRQCNYTKSNATHAVFKRYLEQIKAFHHQTNKLFSDHIPVDDGNRLQAWLTWKEFKKNRWKKRAVVATHDVVQGLEIVESKSSATKIADEEDMDDDDKLFMEMVDTMGLRDPITGAEGVYDSTFRESTRFILTNWNWLWGENKVITGFDVAPFESLGIQIIMKFSKDAQVEFGHVSNFFDWIKAIQGM